MVLSGRQLREWTPGFDGSFSQIIGWVRRTSRRRFRFQVLALIRRSLALPRPTTPGARLGWAIFFILLAVLLFDIQGAFIKFMGDRYPVQQIAVFRNFFGLLPNVIFLFLSQEWHRSGRQIGMPQWKLTLVRGVLLTTAQFCLYTSLVNLEFATASSLVFAAPLFITMLSIPVLGHKVSGAQWLAVANSRLTSDV